MAPDDGDDDTPGTDVAVSGGEAGEAVGLPDRPFQLEDVDDLIEQSLSVTDAQIAADFGTDTRAHLARDGNGWVARVHGPGFGHHVADALGLSQVMGELAKATRWIGNGLYPTFGHAPGVALARAGGSAVMHFTAGLTEEPIDVGEEEVFASVVGGQYLAVLLAQSTNHEELTRLLAPLGRRAVGTYTTALAGLVDRELGIDTVVRPTPGRRSRAPRPVRVTVSLEEVVEDLRYLRTPPRMKREVVEVVGVMEALDDGKQSFAIADDDPPHTRIVGTYDDDIAESLMGLWRRRVAARVEVVGPEHEWMPSAGKVTRRLLSAERSERRRL